MTTFLLAVASVVVAFVAWLVFSVDRYIACAACGHGMAEYLGLGVYHCKDCGSTWDKNVMEKRQ